LALIVAEESILAGPGEAQAKDVVTVLPAKSV
jgi:hypothetical protein